MRLGAPAVGAVLAAGALILWNQDSNNRATASTALQPRTVEIPVSIFHNVRSPQPPLPKGTKVEEVPPPPSYHAAKTTKRAVDSSSDAFAEVDRNRNSGGGMSVFDIIKLTSPQQVPSESRGGLGLIERSQEQPPLPPPPPEITASNERNSLQHASHRSPEAGLEDATSTAAAASTTTGEEANNDEVPGNGRALRRKMGRAKSRGSAETPRSRSDTRDELSVNQEEAGAAESSAPGVPSHWGPPTSGSPSSSKQAGGGTCSAKTPTSGKLRVVSDITKESAHVTLVSDAHLPQRFSKPPQPVMSDDGSALKNKWCPQFKWRFCPNPKRGDEDRNWYTCEARQFVGQVPCGYIDNTAVIPGMVYDASRTYPVHGCHPHKLNFQPAPNPKKVVKIGPSVAHNLAVYPTGFAHVMAQLPRLVHLVQSIPKDVPILLAPSSGRDALLNILHAKKVLDKNRIINWKSDTVYTADTVYYAGEMGKGKGTKGQWDTLKQEWCSWALVMPRQRLQKLFVGTRTVHEDRQKNSTAVGTSSSGRKSPFDGTRILVVHRRDASGGRRMLRNHAQLMEALTGAFPSAIVTEFVGDKYSMAQSIEAFGEADVVVAPHGAALGFLASMRPTAACVEIGYKELKGMKFPAPYYMALALSVNVAYFMSMADGGYGTPLVADVSDVVAVTKKAVQYVNSPGAPPPNIA